MPAKSSSGVYPTDSKLVTWDRDFNELSQVAFSPSPALLMGHYGGVETQLYSPEDGIVYLNSFNEIHLIAYGAYYHVGTDAIIYNYEMFGGWGVRDDILKVYGTATNTLTTWRIHFE